MHTYCIRIKFVKSLALVASDGRTQQLYNFVSEKSALGFIKDKKLEEKVYPFAMLDHNFWYDYKKISLKKLQNAEFDEKFSVWRKTAL